MPWFVIHTTRTHHDRLTVFEDTPYLSEREALAAAEGMSSHWQRMGDTPIRSVAVVEAHSAREAVRVMLEQEDGP